MGLRGCIGAGRQAGRRAAHHEIGAVHAQAIQNVLGHIVAKVLAAHLLHHHGSKHGVVGRVAHNGARDKLSFDAK